MRLMLFFGLWLTSLASLSNPICDRMPDYSTNLIEVGDHNYDPGNRDSLMYANHHIYTNLMGIWDENAREEIAWSYQYDSIRDAGYFYLCSPLNSDYIDFSYLSSGSGLVSIEVNDRDPVYVTYDDLGARFSLAMTSFVGAYKWVGKVYFKEAIKRGDLLKFTIDENSLSFVSFDSVLFGGSSSSDGLDDLESRISKVESHLGI